MTIQMLDETQMTNPGRLAWAESSVPALVAVSALFLLLSQSPTWVIAMSGLGAFVLMVSFIQIGNAYWNEARRQPGVSTVDATQSVFVMISTVPLILLGVLHLGALYSSIPTDPSATYTFCTFIAHSAMVAALVSAAWRWVLRRKQRQVVAGGY